MSGPQTLLRMSGADMRPAQLEDAAVVLIDCQMEYVSGGLKLPGADAALDEVLQITAKARHTGAPILHVVHRGAAGSLFDLDGPGGQIAPQAAPISGERIVQKSLPNAFGHAEFGGSGAWADPEQNLSVALIVNSGLGSPFGDLRILGIGGAAVRSADKRRRRSES